jgi:transposase
MLDALIRNPGPRNRGRVSLGTLRRTLPQVRKALDGRLAGQDALTVPRCWPRTTSSTRRSPSCRPRIEELVAPARAMLSCPTRSRGHRKTAALLLVEIGPDMRRFPSHHLASWAGLCAGHNESAGKR